MNDKEKKLPLIARDLNKCLRKFHIKKDDKKFIPHATVGRVKNIHNKEILLKAIEISQNKEFGFFTVDKITFMQSRLTPEGPIYTPLKELWLYGNNINSNF